MVKNEKQSETHTVDESIEIVKKDKDRKRLTNEEAKNNSEIMFGSYKNVLLKRCFHDIYLIHITMWFILQFSTFEHSSLSFV